MAISYEDVADAAETLLEDGKEISEITLRRVRAELGTGSMGTISPLLSKWKKTLQDKAEKRSAVTLSEELQNMIAAEIGRLLEKSSLSSSKRIEDLEAQLAEVGKHYKALEENHAIAVSDLKTVNGFAKSLREDNQCLKADLEKEKKELRDLQVNAVEFRVKAEATEEENSKLTRKIEKTMAECEKLKEALSEANQKRAVAEARLDERTKAKQPK